MLQQWLGSASRWAALGVMLGGSTLASGQIDQTKPTFTDLSRQIWQDALHGKGEASLAGLHQVPADHSVQALAGLRASSDALDDAYGKRETSRGDKLENVLGEFEAELAKPVTPFTLSESLRAAIEWQVYSSDDEHVLDEPRVKGLVSRVEEAAAQSERQGDWLMANELYYRLHLLLEKRSAAHKRDIERLSARLEMLRLYVPERLWELRNEHQVARGDDPLPAYNGLGEDYREKLDGISLQVVLGAVLRSANNHIDRVDDRPLLGDMMQGSIRQIRTMVTTSDLERVFPELGNPAAVRTMTDFLDAQAATMIRPDRHALRRFVDRLLSTNERSVQIPLEALLHEFGNGAMGVLDEFSAIIWPDEMRRFQRMTQGQFIGVGIQIQLDQETQMIKVVTPLEGTPAQRAGVQRDDLIKAVDGKSALGISLNQAVDQITGPAGTNVTLTLLREENEVDIDLRRAVIKLPSVKGWRRTGAGDEEWEWFIDEDQGIGYIRLVSFSDDTTRDLRRAIDEMQDVGLNGLILDLRFNPGGLLTEAVTVANTFIERGDIVSTEGTIQGETKRARPSRARVTDIPVAVLINEGSASASEIVSGAIRHYADKQDIRAVLVGQRSFGKGSVQNVWPLSHTESAALKLTTQYYMLPGGERIHRMPGATTWGVEPHVTVEMLPEQITEALTIRQNADVLPINELGEIIAIEDEERPDPDKLIDDGIDLQLQTALVLLRTQAIHDRVEAGSLVLN